MNQKIGELYLGSEWMALWFDDNIRGQVRTHQGLC